MAGQLLMRTSVSMQNGELVKELLACAMLSQRWKGWSKWKRLLVVSRNMPWLIQIITTL